MQSANLDFLRAIAVLAVYFAHLHQALGYEPSRLGHIGVLIFFVHTSLVLMMSMERLRLTGRDLFATFYTRRFLRIYPLSMAAVLAAGALELPPAPWARYRPLGAGDFLSNLALTQNLTHSDSVIGPLWSLPYEVQMYCALPFLFLIARRAHAGRILAGMLIVSALAALVQPHIVSRLDVVQYAPCFLSGVIAYRVSQSTSRRIPAWLWPPAVLAVVGSYLPAPAAGRFRSWAVCLLLGLILPHFREIEWGWLAAPARLIARYSYGIYLTHIVVMWLAFVRMSAAPAFLRWTVLAALSVGLPVLAYHALELPLIRLAARLTTPAAIARRVPAFKGESGVEAYSAP